MPFLPSTPGSNFQDYLFNQQQDSRKRGRRGADNDRGEESKPVDPITVATEEARNAGDASMQAAMEAAKPTLEAQETERQFQMRQRSMGKNRISRISGSYRDAAGVKRNARTSEPMEGQSSQRPQLGQTNDVARVSSPESPSRLNREPAVGFRGMAPPPPNIALRPTPRALTPISSIEGKSGSYTGDVKVVKGQYGTAMAQTGENLKRIAVREQNRPMTEAIADGAKQDAASRDPSAGVMRALAQGGGTTNAMPSNPREIAERSNIVMPSTPDQIANLRNQMPVPGSGPTDYVPTTAGSSFPVMPGAAQAGTASIPTPSNTMAPVTPGISPAAQQNKINISQGVRDLASNTTNQFANYEQPPLAAKRSNQRATGSPPPVNQFAATPSTGILARL